MFVRMSIICFTSRAGRTRRFSRRQQEARCLHLKFVASCRRTLSKLKRQRSIASIARASSELLRKYLELLEFVFCCIEWKMSENTYNDPFAKLVPSVCFFIAQFDFKWEIDFSSNTLFLPRLSVRCLKTWHLRRRESGFRIKAFCLRHQTFFGWEMRDGKPSGGLRWKSAHISNSAQTSTWTNAKEIKLASSFWRFRGFE